MQQQNKRLLLSLLLYFHFFLPIQMFSRFSRFGTILNRPSLRCFATQQRPPSNDLSIDVNLLGTQLDLVKTHLQARFASEELINQVEKIPDLRTRRNHLISEGDSARNTRN